MILFYFKIDRIWDLFFLSFDNKNFNFTLADKNSVDNWPELILLIG